MTHFQNAKHLVVVAGPTAVGKTSFAIHLAEEFQTVILSADARQFYQEMSIGTAKPSSEELDRIPHHLVDFLPITEPYTVADFEAQALALLHQLFEKHDVVVVSGGSGLYIKALLQGLDEMPAIESEVREALDKEILSGGLAALVDELKAKDPEYAKEADLNNPRRVQRAMEVIRQTGLPFSSFRKKQSAPRFFKSTMLVLDRPREELYARINQRVEVMMTLGLLEECRRLLPFRQLNALQTVGYTELFAYFDGHCDLNTAVALIKQNSRRYAKRQLTWFRKQEGAVWLHPDDLQKAVAIVRKAMQ